MFSGNILVIIQRSNGDVFLSSSLIVQLQQHLNPDAIDLLVNDDTLAIAKTLPNIRQIYTFSYQKKKQQRWRQEKQIVKKQYVGPVFRYSDSTQGSNQRQFTQQGCELIGDASADADVEILNLSLLALQKSGLETATVKLGHMGYLNEPMILGAIAGVEASLEATGIPYEKGGIDAAVEFLAAG